MCENGACTCRSCVPIRWWSHRFALRVSGCCCCNQRNSNEKAPTEHTRKLQNALRAFETQKQLFCFGFFWSPVLKSQAGPTLVGYTRESQRVLSGCQASHQPRALVAIAVLLMGWSTFWKRGRKIPRAAKKNEYEMPFPLLHLFWFCVCFIIGFVCFVLFFLVLNYWSSHLKLQSDLRWPVSGMLKHQCRGCRYRGTHPAVPGASLGSGTGHLPLHKVYDFLFLF